MFNFFKKKTPKNATENTGTVDQTVKSVPARMDDMDRLSSPKSNNNDGTVLGKVFGYFFGE